MVERPHDPIVGAGFLEEIEAAQKRCAIAEDAEDPCSHAASAGISGAPILLRHVKVKRIGAPIYRHRISEAPISFVPEYLLVGSVLYRRGLDRHRGGTTTIVTSGLEALWSRFVRGRQWDFFR